MKRVVYVCNKPTQNQLVLGPYLKKQFDFSFIFYESTPSGRPDWWACEALPDSDVSLECSSRSARVRYPTPKAYPELTKADPDVVILGGFTILGNIVANFWAIRNNRPTVVVSEIFRSKTGKIRSPGDFRFRILRLLYRNVAMILATTDEARDQFRQAGFKSAVEVCTYACDIEHYLTHELRGSWPRQNILFANRLIDIYQPLVAIEAFARVVKTAPGARLFLNADGDLRGECEALIARLDIGQATEFLDSLQSWRDLDDIYRESDILILPASFSAGNFSVIEAMASGMGIVVSRRVPGYADLLTDGTSAWKIEPTVDAAEEALRKYLDSPQTLHEHGARAREQTHGYTAAVVAERIGEIIDKIAEDPS